MSQINMIESIDGSGVTSLGIWNNCIVASYANGMIRFFDPENGKIRLEVYKRMVQIFFCFSTNVWIDWSTCAIH